MRLCACGEDLSPAHNLLGDYCCRKCGRWYNGFGQSLAPPSQWGEETGEHFDDDGNFIGADNNNDE